MKWYGKFALVFLLFILAGIVYAGANTDKIGFVVIPVAFATHDPTFNHPTPFETPLTMTLDQETYKTGETIKIFGTITNKDSESLVIITLFKPIKTDVTQTQMILNDEDGSIVPYPSVPHGAVVTTTQMLLNDNGTVAYQFKAGSGNMDISGIYSIKMEHESTSITREFSFNVVEDAPFFGIFVYIDDLFSWIVGK